MFGPSTSQPARLAYYENEKKWKARTAPRREIVLEKCFNINRKQDTRDSRDRWVIALYTLDDCVSIMFETEAELDDWLDQLLTLQQGKKGNVEGKKLKPTYEHMWQVNIKNFKPDTGNGQSFPAIVGPNRLCVTNTSVKFFPLGVERCHEFPHACLRGCGYNDRVFTIETGRNSPSGPGRLVIECDEKDTMHRLHETILEAMKASKSKDLYLKQSSSRPQPSSSRPRSFSLSTSKADSLHPPKTIPAYIPAYDLGAGSRSRTISEPPDSASGPPGKSCLRFSTSPSVNSPISPLGSASLISSDGTGSSSSINEHLDTTATETPTVMDVLTEESSGEMSIELRSGGTDYTARHEKHLSLTEDDYMMMTGGPTTQDRVPPLPLRHAASPYSSSLPSSHAASQPRPATVATSPPESQSSSFGYSESCGATPVLGDDDPGDYLAMDMLSVRPVTTSTPVKSSSSLTLVPSPDGAGPAASNAALLTAAAAITTTPAMSLPGATVAKTSPVTIRSSGDQDGRQRVPSGDSDYVVMSPDVPVKEEEPSSRLALEERMGGGRSRGHVTGSPRHSSPASSGPRKATSLTGSKRNSSCLDDNEWIGCDWRLVEEVSEDQPGGEGKDEDVYMSVYYPKNTSHNVMSAPSRDSRVSPASSSSLVSGTPDSSRYGDFHLEKVVSQLRESDGSDPPESRLLPTGRPPRAMTLDTTSCGGVRRPPGTAGHRYIDIPPSGAGQGGNSKSSSKSNLSPYSGTPPPASSPSLASQIIGGLFRHRAGSVPTRQPMPERRRHRTQSEGEKEQEPKNP